MNITSGNADWDNIIEMLYEDERVKERLYRYVMSSLIFGRQGFGKNYATAEKIRHQAALYSSIYDNSLDSREMGSFTIKKDVPTTLPQKVCNYRKSKVDWYGTETPRYSLRSGPAHFDVSRMILKGRDPKDGLSVFVKEIGDEIETRTYHKGDFNWSPQGEIILMSGSKLPQIKDKD